MLNDDDSLLNELKSGQMAAFEQIFMKYHKLLCADAYHLLGDEMECDDIVQNLFIEIWDKKLYLNIDQSVKAYLRTAVRNRCLSKIAKKNTEKKRLDRYGLNIIEEIEEDHLERKELSQEMGHMISELPGQRLHAFDLVYLQGKPYKEAATEMGISINSLKTHLKLAVRSLRERMQIFR